MATQIQSLEACVNRLQKEAKEFMTYSKLLLNDVTIQPTEIEVYYYHAGKFADTSVHQNELQQNNAYHFYIHRYGLKNTDSIKGGNRAGIDFVLSDEANKYYTYLIRSAVINNKLIVGPHKVLVAIQEASHLDFAEIEKTAIQIVEDKVTGVVLFSKRINLGKNAGEFGELKLRAVLCDDSFIEHKYPAKEQMITDYILNRNMPQEQAIEFARQKLGYIPKTVRQL